MDRKTYQLLWVLIIATAIATIGSHLLAAWLKIKTVAAEAYTIGTANGTPPAFAAGSSVAGYGIEWDDISKQLHLKIKSWGIAAGSPVEHEQFQKQVPEARTTFLVVSLVDLDEASVSDFRAAIVPIGRTIGTLREMDADYDQWQRALKQYPLTWLRILFPTLGRSRAIMGMLRIQAANLLHASKRTSAEMAGPTIKFVKNAADDEYKRQKLSDWSASKVISKQVALRESLHGPHSFHGAKLRALERMIQYGVQRSRTIVIVLPMSAAYKQGTLSTELIEEFESALQRARERSPGAEWLRLDQLEGLAVDENFCDLDHLNVYGQQIATEAFQTWLKQHPNRP